MIKKFKNKKRCSGTLVNFTILTKKNSQYRFTIMSNNKIDQLRCHSFKSYPIYTFK